jgi:hypothetical protein
MADCSAAALAAAAWARIRSAMLRDPSVRFFGWTTLWEKTFLQNDVRKLESGENLVRTRSTK